jgi:hypothetical protein
MNLTEVRIGRVQRMGDTFHASGTLIALTLTPEGLTSQRWHAGFAVGPGGDVPSTRLRAWLERLRLEQHFGLKAPTDWRAA